VCLVEKFWSEAVFYLELRVAIPTRRNSNPNYARVSKLEYPNRAHECQAHE
jgi:hypothetical protein